MAKKGWNMVGIGHRIWDWQGLGWEREGVCECCGIHTQYVCQSVSYCVYVFVSFSGYARLFFFSVACVGFVSLGYVCVFLLVVFYGVSCVLCFLVCDCFSLPVSAVSLAMYASVFVLFCLC